MANRDINKRFEKRSGDSIGIEEQTSLLETGLGIMTWSATYSSQGLNSGTPNA
jgi:hypothetical protein